MTSEITLKVGKKGEIYLPSKLRKKMSIKPGDLVRVRLEEKRMIVEKEKRIEDLLGDYIFEVDAQEIEETSEDTQREAGILE